MVTQRDIECARSIYNCLTITEAPTAYLVDLPVTKISELIAAHVAQETKGLNGWVITPTTPTGGAAKITSHDGDYVYLTVGNSKAGYVRLVKALANTTQQKEV